MRRFWQALLLMLAVPYAACAESVHSPGGWTLTVDAATGEYAVTTQTPAWTVGGTLPTPLEAVKTEHGTDAIGSFSAIAFAWHDGGRRSGSIRIYDARPLALFSVKYDDAVDRSPPAFPVLTKLPPKVMPFRYGETDHLRPELFQLNGTEPDEQYGGPFALFDDQANTMIVSPASNFMVAMMSGGLQEGLRSGLNRTLTSVPAGYEQQTLLAIGPGINRTWDAWGQGLTSLYGKQRPANDADAGLKYLGYWTDNGSHYYYNYDAEKGYAETILAVKNHLLSQGIPVHYMQLDSWWCGKTFASFKQKDSNKPRSKDPNLPAGSWNRYGGMLTFAGAPELFPDGIGPFQKKLELPLVVHSRWIDPESAYHATYHISGVAPVDRKWWDRIAADAAAWGVMTYEQDWNNWIYLKSPELSTTTWAGDQYLDGMAGACADHGLTMQYCMVTPRFLLQGGAKYPNLTTVRVSGDRFERGKWREFLFGSTLAKALGVWPWTDVYRSSETPNILIATLSGGMVGLSDRIGDENAANIFRAVRKDGVIVKPDAPLTPIDASFIAAATAQSKGKVVPTALISATHTGEGAERAEYVFACTSQAKDPPDTAWTVNAGELGITTPALAYDFFSGAAQIVDAAHPLTGQLNHDHDWAYWVLAPVGPSGMALVGDTGLFVTRGRQRCESIADDGQAIQAKVVFAPSESSVTLTVYAPTALRITSQGGSITQQSYDAARNIATVHVAVDQPANGDSASAVRTVTVSMSK